MSRSSSKLAELHPPWSSSRVSNMRSLSDLNPKRPTHDSPRTMRRDLLLLFLVSALGASLAACSKGDALTEHAEIDAPIEVALHHAVKERIPVTLELDGTLAPNRSAKLSPLVSGHIAEVHVERGDRVKAGDPLISLRRNELSLAARAASQRAAAHLRQLGVDRIGEFDPEALPEVIAAKAALDQEEDQLRRYTQLYEHGSIDERSFAQAQLMTDAARARYQSALQQAKASAANYQALSAEAALRQADAANTVLRAPFDGSVVERMGEVGEFISSQSPAVELVDASQLRLNLAVPERFADSIFEGQEAEILISGTSHRLRGEVRYIAAAIDEATRTLRIEVLTPNPDGALRAGHFARARLNLGGEREVIRVPKDALSERAGVYRLYVRGEDNRAIASLVTVIESDGDEFLIDASELPDRVELILSPPRMLQDGSPITASMEG